MKSMLYKGLSIFSLVVMWSVSSSSFSGEGAKVGTVFEVIEDYDFGRSKTFYVFQPDDAKTQVRLSDNLVKGFNLRSLDRISIEGMEKKLLDNIDSTNQILFHDSLKINRLLPQKKLIKNKRDSNSFRAFETGETSIKTTDLRRAVHLILDFNDFKASDREEFSEQSLGRYMFGHGGSVHDTFMHGSINKVGWQEDVDGDGSVLDRHIVRLDSMVEGQCSTHTWAEEALENLRTQGISLDLYQHRIFYIPREAGCNWGGLAWVDCGDSCRAWIKQANRSVLGHELGHNLGLRHAGTDPENDGEVNVEYGDEGSVMSVQGSHMFNIVNRNHLGWWGSYEHLRPTVTESGQYTLQPFQFTQDQFDGNPIGLKILKPGTGDTYYSIAYQAQSDRFNPDGKFDQRLKIHRKGNGTGGSVRIIALNAGQTWEDPTSDLKITLVSGEPHQAVVNIDSGVSLETTCINLDELNPNVTFTNETHMEARDGSITLSFPEQLFEHSLMFFHISLDGGETYLKELFDNSDSQVLPNLTPGRYDLWIRNEGGECTRSLGGGFIESSKDYVLLPEPSQTATPEPLSAPTDAPSSKLSSSGLEQGGAGGGSLHWWLVIVLGIRAGLGKKTGNDFSTVFGYRSVLGGGFSGCK